MACSTRGNPLRDRLMNRIAGDARLNPSRRRLAEFVQRAADSVPSGSLVLDAGAGDCRYRVHFARHDYESADFAAVDKDYSGNLTYVCDLREIPVEDQRYDLVLLTQVLEHIPEPGRVLGELRRVLKPGGAIWLSAPLFYPEHEQPYDFFRYTQFGHRFLLEGAGFEVEAVGWIEGYFATLAFQLQTGALRLPAGFAHYGGGVFGALTWAAVQLMRPVMLALSVGLSRADTKRPYTEDGHCKNYWVVARVPVDSA